MASCMRRVASTVASLPCSDPGLEDAEVGLFSPVSLLLPGVVTEKVFAVVLATS